MLAERNAGKGVEEALWSTDWQVNEGGAEEDREGAGVGGREGDG